MVHYDEKPSDAVIITAFVLRVIWFCVSLYAALYVGSFIGEVWRMKAAQWCLDDIAACNKTAGYTK